MPRPLFAVPLALALCMPAMGQDPPPTPAPFVPVAAIDAPSFVPPGGRLVLLPGEGVKSKDPLDWQVIAPANAPFTIEGRALIVKDPIPGVTYRFVQIANGDKPAFRFAFADVPIQAGPTPTPTPGPTPAPIPTPIDPPAPVPDAVGNLRVLILYESTAGMSAGQTATVMGGGGLRQYLERKCIKGTDGRAEWRIWDKDVDASREPSEWQATLAAAKADPKALPKLCIFAGNTLVEARGLISPGDALAFLEGKAGK